MKPIFSYLHRLQGEREGLGGLKEDEILKSIDEKGLVEFAQELIRFQTINPPADYSDISSCLHEAIKNLGMETRYLEGLHGKRNVFGLCRGRSQERTLLLSGHMDVVPAGDPGKWTYPPFAAGIHEGWLWGRGSVDMKSAIAAQIFAARAVLDSGISLASSFMLGCTVDDETAGAWGMKYAIEEGLRSMGWPIPTLHVLGEANGLNLSISFKGRIWVRLSTRGKSAHGGEPERGVNAIEQMIPFLLRARSVLRQEHPLMGKDTLNLGIIEGGQKVNIVPDACTAHLDLRMCAPAAADQYQQGLEEIIETLKREDSAFEVTEFEVYEKRDPIEMARDHPAIGFMKECIRGVRGKEPHLLGTLSAGDLYHTMKRGIPGAWIGPGNPQLLHQVNERIRVDEIIEAAKIYALLILRFSLEAR
jgi:succinyl-diaminopimelate desuccinylase